MQFFLLCAVFCPIWHTTPAAVIVKPNVGVIFNQRQTVSLPTFHWHHTLAVPISLTLPIISNTSLCHKALENPLCATVLDLQNLYDSINARVQDQLLSTKSDIESIMSMNPSFRMKRGWLNIVGKGAKSIFGLATEDDIHVLKQHMLKLHSLMKNNDRNHIADTKQLHSVQIQSSLRMDNLAAHISTIDDVIGNLTTHFNVLNAYLHKTASHAQKLIRHENWFRELTRILGWNSHYAMQLSSLLETHTIFQALLHDIPHLLDGKLTPNIVSPTTISQIFDQIDLQLRTLPTSFKIDCDVAYFYRNKHTVLSTFHDDAIFLKLKIPITVNSFQFSLFQIDILPVPADSNHSIYTHLQNVPSFLLLSVDNSTYLDLTHDQQLRLNDPSHLRTILPKNVSGDVCILNVYFDLHHLLSTTCHIALKHKPLFPQNFVYTLPNHVYLLYSPNTIWSVTCPAQVNQVFSTNGLFTVSLKCRCILQSQFTQFTALNVQCLQSSHTIRYSINWFVYDALYKSSVPFQLHPTEFTREPVHFQLPDFLVNMTKLKTYETQDQSLKNAMNTLNVSFSSPMEDDFLDWFDYPIVSSVTSVITYSLAVVNIIIVIVLIYVCLKLYAMSKLLATLALTSKPAVAIHFTLPTPSPTDVVPQYLFTWTHIQILILALICLGIIALTALSVYALRRQRSIYNLNVIHSVRISIVVIVSSLTDDVLVKVLDFPVLANEVPVLQLSATGLQLGTNWLRPILSFNWSDVSLALAPHTFPLPQSLPLSFLQFLHLRHILQGPHTIQFLSVSTDKVDSLCSWTSPASSTFTSTPPASSTLYPSLDVADTSASPSASPAKPSAPLVTLSFR